MSDIIHTFTGKTVRPLDMRARDIVIEDVCHALSNQCRFSGHTSEFYSVAQHAVIVSTVLEGTGFEWWGLHHDDSEAYLVDLPRPLKTDQYFGKPYRGAETRVMRAVAERFELLPWPMPPEVKAADEAVLATEMRDLMRGVKFRRVRPHQEVPIHPLSPRKSRELFMARYDELVARRGGS